jgi:hypothetical protein
MQQVPTDTKRRVPSLLDHPACRFDRSYRGDAASHNIVIGKLY